MFRKLRIARRLTLLVVGGAGLVLGGTAVQSTFLAQHLLEVELEGKARALAVATANQIATVEREVAVAADGLAATLEELAPSQQRVVPLIESILRRCPRAYGSAVALDPHAAGAQVAPYVYRSAGALVAMDLAEGEYNYEIWDWYVLPRELRRPVWTEPYFDEGAGNILMATYSVPLLRRGASDGFWGVVTCDLSLEWLSELLQSLPLGESGYAFLISPTGRLIAHPEPDFVMNETVFSLAEERDRPELRELGRRMVRGESDFVPYSTLRRGAPAWLVFVPVTGTGWSLGAVFPQEAISAKVRTLRRWLLAVGAVGFGFLLVITVAIAGSITKPLRRLEAATEVLASGDLDADLPKIRGEDEIAHLATSFGKMQRDLKAFVEELRVTTAARERMESELEIAHAIQMSFVPKTFPPYPGRSDMDIYAVLEPARQVGGDLYDLFLLDDDHLCIAIGDVSGKGVPAALFMAATRTLFKSLFHDQRNTAHVFSRLNSELADGNETSMFVTMFCAVIDLTTGHCRYASGGHNPPLLLRADGSVEELPAPKGLLVGAFGSADFEEATLELKPGETLFLFTDGVVEAFNPAEELFGDERTVEVVRQFGGLSCREMVEKMRREVEAFAAGAEQSDDITMLAFTYLGPQ